MKQRVGRTNPAKGVLSQIPHGTSARVLGGGGPTAQEILASHAPPVADKVQSASTPRGTS